jgi:4-hydroxy-tetrahydrodipicolinate synthase
MALPYARSEVKDRARSWEGACNVTLPTFTNDFARLNPNAIAHDVKLAAEMGFWGTLVASESGTTVEEYVEFLAIAVDAAPSGFHIVSHLSFDTLDDTRRVADASVALGAEAGLVSYPPAFRPARSADIVEWTERIAGETDLALILFAVMTWGYRPLHPSGFPFDALEAMAKLDTAAAIKLEFGGTALAAAFHEMHRRVGDLVVIENPLESQVPGLHAHYGMRWIGTSAYESFGDRVPRWFRLLNAGQWDAAMDVFWSYQPARDAKGAFHHTFAGANLIHRVGWKYLGWLNGFNGGLLRMPTMRLNPGQMKSLRAGLQASGFDLPIDDEAFYEGRHPA